MGARRFLSSGAGSAEHLQTPIPCVGSCEAQRRSASHPRGQPLSRRLCRHGWHGVQPARDGFAVQPVATFLNLQETADSNLACASRNLAIESERGVRSPWKSGCWAVDSIEVKFDHSGAISVQESHGSIFPSLDEAANADGIFAGEFRDVERSAFAIDRYGAECRPVSRGQ